MNNIVNLNRISAAQTECSMVGPYQPKNTAPIEAFKNSDVYQAPPARIAAIKATPVQPRPVSTWQPQAANEPVKMSMIRRIGVAVGALLAIGGVIGGLVSIVALGPLGLAVAAGSAMLGAAILRQATR